MEEYLIKQVSIVNEGTIFIGDVHIKNGRIYKIAPMLNQTNSTKLIHAEGKFLFPGMIDDQVHFREPGLTHKADIESESKAAVAGGITSYMEMPNCTPATLTAKRLKEKHKLAAEKSHANYAFYLGASNDNLDEIINVDTHDACGVKIFMGSSTGNMLVDDPRILEEIFAKSPILIATHCEDTPTIIENEKKYRSLYGSDVPMAAHPSIRSEDACYKSSFLAVELAKKHGTKLHVLHITTAKELDLFDNTITLAEKKITAEVCAHHLYYNDKDYVHKGSLIKCNPAIKTENDRKSLLNALNNNLVDIIATDHAPHTIEEKNNSYFNAPSGLPLVQYALISLLEHYHNGILSLEKIVEKTAHAPATVFEIFNRGFIREGYWADLVLIDLDSPTIARNQDVISKCAWTPFAGQTFKSKIELTFVNGILKYADGGIINETKGHKIEFQRL